MLMSPQNIVQGPDDISSGVIAIGGSYSSGCDPTSDPTCTPTTVQGQVQISQAQQSCPSGNCGNIAGTSNLPLLILIVAVAVVLLR